MARLWSLSRLVHVLNFLVELAGALALWTLSVPGMKQILANNTDARRLIPMMGVGMQGTIAVVSLAALVCSDTDRFGPLFALAYFHLACLCLFAGPAFHGVKFHEIAEPRTAVGIHAVLLAVTIAALVELYDFKRNSKEDRSL